MIFLTVWRFLLATILAQLVSHPGNTPPVGMTSQHEVFANVADLTLNSEAGTTIVGTMPGFTRAGKAMHQYPVLRQLYFRSDDAGRILIHDDMHAAYREALIAQPSWNGS